MLSRPPVPPDGSGRKVPAAAHAIRRRRSLNLSAYQRATGRVSPARPMPGSPTSPERHTIHAPNAPSIPVQSTVHPIAIRQTHFPAPSRARPTRIYTREPRPNNGQPIYPHSAHPRAARQWSNDASDRTTRQSRSAICFRPAATPSAGSIGRDRTGFIAHEAGL